MTVTPIPQPNTPDREAILQDIYASLQAALEKVNLAERFGGFEAVEEWGDCCP